MARQKSQQYVCCRWLEFSFVGTSSENEVAGTNKTGGRSRDCNRGGTGHGASCQSGLPGLGLSQVTYELPGADLSAFFSSVDSGVHAGHGVVWADRNLKISPALLAGDILLILRIC